MRAFCKGFTPCRRVGRPCVGVIFEGADLRLGQGAEPGLGERGQRFGHLRTPRQCQQCLDRRCRCAELGRGRLVAIQRDPGHPELIPHGGAVFGDVAADHRDLSAADALPHQTPDGTGGGAGFFFPAGGGKQPHFGGGHVQRRAAAGLQNLSQCRQSGSLFVPDIPAQEHRRGDLGSVFPRQLPQLGGDLLCPREKAQIPRRQGGAVVAQSHRDRRQSRQHRPHETFLGRIEGVELVDEHLPLLQKGGQCAPGEGIFQPDRRQLQPVGRIHAGAGQQGLVALEDQRQLCQFAAFGPAVLGEGGQLPARKPRALQFVDGLGRHLAERCAPAVAVVVVYMILQLFQRAPHQHRPTRIGQGLHRRAALGGEDLFGQTRKRKALHPAGQCVAQLPVDAGFRRRGELLRHQQDAAPASLGPRLDLRIQQRRLAAARAS